MRTGRVAGTAYDPRVQSGEPTQAEEERRPGAILVIYSWDMLLALLALLGALAAFDGECPDRGGGARPRRPCHRRPHRAPRGDLVRRPGRHPPLHHGDPGVLGPHQRHPDPAPGHPLTLDRAGQIIESRSPTTATTASPSWPWSA